MDRLITTLKEESMRYLGIEINAKYATAKEYFKLLESRADL